MNSPVETETPDMFAYPCPSCSQRLLAPPERVGQRTICPKCLSPVTVPSPDDQPVDQFDPAENQPIDVDTPMPVHTELSRELALAELDLGRDKELAATVPVIDLGAIPVNNPPRPPVVSAPQPQPQPAPQPSSQPAPRVALRQPTREREGQVTLNPVSRFGTDLAELSCAISMRMAPPPEPSATDRTTAFVGWIGGVTAGVILWVLGVLHSPTWFPYVALAGGGMVAFGFLWRAYLSGRGGRWAAGLATLLPPVCVVQLLRPIGDHGLQPLRFVITGLALVALFVTGPAAHAWVEQNLGVLSEPTKPTTTKSVTTAEEATAAAARLGDKKEREAAKQTLVKLGADAEPAVLPLLAAKSEASVLLACDVLEVIGGEKALAELRKLADDPATSRAVRVEAAAAAEAIAKRLDSKK